MGWSRRSSAKKSQPLKEANRKGFHPLSGGNIPRTQGIDMNMPNDAQGKAGIPEKIKYYSPPWDPYRAISYGFLISWVLSGIILGFNWQRLGKPRWLFPTVIIFLLIQGSALAIMLLWIDKFRTVSSMPFAFLFYVPALMVGVIFGAPLALARMQQGAFKRYRSDGREAMLEYPYDFTDAVLFGILISVGLGIFFLVLFTLLNPQGVGIAAR